MQPDRAPRPLPKRTWAPLWLSVAIAAALSAGCVVRRSSAPIPPSPPPPQLGPRPAPPRAPPPQAAARDAHAADDRDALRADPEASRVFFANLGRPSAPVTPTTAPPRVTAMALENTARGEAEGAAPMAGPFVTALREGERATLPVTLAPGECATFIAHGGLGVIEVDLFLTTGAAPQVQVLGEDVRTGPIAVIGGRRSGCFANNTRANLQVDLHASVRRGSGVVILRSFKR